MIIKDIRNVKMGKHMVAVYPDNFMEYKENAALLRKLFFAKEKTFKLNKESFNEEIDTLIDRQLLIRDKAFETTRVNTKSTKSSNSKNIKYSSSYY
jgi:hypothetical protein